MKKEMWMETGAAAEGTMDKTAGMLAALEENNRLLEEKNQRLMEEKAAAEKELLEVKKTAAAERMVLEAGGRNAKAILALVDLEGMEFDEKIGLAGMAEALEQVKAEAPYLFLERKEKTVGTGFAPSQQKKRESEISRQFKSALRR